MCRPVLQILTLFQTKKCYFQHPFSDQTSKIQTRFQTWPVGRIYVIITQIRAQTKKFYKSTQNSHISLSSYSFGIEMINTFIHSRSRSLENHTRFQTNMGKSYTPFHTKKPQKPLPPPFGPNCSLNPYPEFTSDLIQTPLKTSRIRSRRISCKENKSNRGRLVQRCSKLRTTTFCKDLFLKKKEI